MVKALADAPVGTLRDNLFMICVLALITTVWLARTWAGAIFGTLIFVLAAAGGRAAQLRAEQDGRVEQERLRQEKARSDFQEGPRWFRVLFVLFALAVLAWLVLDLLITW